MGYYLVYWWVII